MVKATAVRDGDGARLAVNVIEDVTEVKRAELAQRFLAEAGAVLASSLDYEQTLAAGRRAGGPAARRLVRGEHARRRRLLRSVAVAHADPAKVALRARATSERYPTPRRRARPAPPQVLRDGALAGRQRRSPTSCSTQPIARRRAARAARAALGMRAVMIVPMVAGGRAIGVITLRQRRVRPRVHRTPTSSSPRSSAAAPAPRSRTRACTRERSHIAAHAAARPAAGRAAARSPACGSPRCTARRARRTSSAATSTTRSRPTRGWMLLVGDVTGRGAEAAALTGQARHTLRTAGMLLGDPRRALEQLNRALAERRELTPCTVAIVHSSSRRGPCERRRLRRPSAAAARSATARSRAVGRFGPMLGAWADSGWQRASASTLEPGDVLVLYTDGVTDAARRGRALRRGAPARDAARARPTPSDAVARIDARAERVRGRRAGRRHRGARRRIHGRPRPGRLGRRGARRPR